jgi:uncharacterized protein
MTSRFLTRRALLRTALATTFTGAGCYLYAHLVEPHWLEWVQRDLPIRNLPDALAGSTLMQISDIHVGPVVADDYLLDTFTRAAEFRPDLVVLTGDYLTSRRDEEVEHAACILRHLPLGRLATLAILGNHDYAANYSRLWVANKMTGLLGDLGIQVLRNSRVQIVGLTIAGLDDLLSPLFRPQHVLPTLDPAVANLVLCHNPDAADQPVWAGYQGWILCGHTHGGQCKAPFFTPPIVPVSNTRYIAGEVDLGDGRRLYINRGVGHLRQVRFNARPEITVFTLTRDTSSDLGVKRESAS